MNISRNRKKTSLIFAMIIIAFLYIQTPKVMADGPHGWFVPAVKYVDSNLPNGCDYTTHASTEIVLAEMGTQSQISGDINVWGVGVYNRSTGNEVRWYGYNGQKVSGRICFDPKTEVLVPVVEKSANYLRFQGNNVQPNDPYPLEMRGHHFRGYIHLVSTSATNQKPFVAPYWPVTWLVFELIPSTFEVANYGNDSLYGAGKEVDTTTLHLLNHDTGEYFNRISKTPGNSEIKNVPTPSGLTSGVYYWLTNESMAGEVNVSGPGGLDVEFAGIPLSGMSSGGCFVIDSIPPESHITDPVLVSEDPFSVSVNNPISDIYVGLKSTVVYLIEINGNSAGKLVKTATYNYAYDDAISVANPKITFSGLKKNKSYRVYAITTDHADNTTTSNEVIFDHSTIGTDTTPDIGAGILPTVVNVGAVSNPLEATTVNFRAEVTSEGSHPVTERGFCWNDVNSFPSDFNDSYYSDPYYCWPATGIGLGNFSLFWHSLPPDKDLFYIGYAVNDQNERVNSNALPFDTHATSGFTPVNSAATDPELSLDSTPSLVRSGDSTDLEWSMKNVPGPELKCEIKGSNGIIDSFTHNYDVSAPEFITGMVNTGGLFSTQDFTFSCSDEVNAKDYSVDTRVKVIGSAFET